MSAAVTLATDIFDSADLLRAFADLVDEEGVEGNHWIEPTLSDHEDVARWSDED
ncbi:hypothetical protein [Erythrobacter mangrovi]|uniref:Uncharacterized protein n=1 Tax=Erythrobacter mangrovi TaxID=2739433 RepID=A0A7D3XT50_9SPHN|nr:hypothetical protein [Erythrobacter mangrovi]QKG72171.1 hypothetical protein HQR01_12790 [Erythrobacter mangrovi]